MQVMEGDLARTIEHNLDRIAHIQLADNPGRHEPGTGEINYPFLYEHLDRIGYAGWVGAEYRPKAGTEAGLGWFKLARKTRQRRPRNFAVHYPLTGPWIASLREGKWTAAQDGPTLTAR